MITSSPSSRNFRVSPVGSVSGSAPRQVSSSRQPRFSFVGPETVPLANRSPGLQVAAVAGVVGEHLRRRPVEVGRRGRGSAAPAPCPARASAPRRSQTSSVRRCRRAALVVGGVEVGQRRGVAGRSREGRHAERLERVERHDPGRDRSSRSSWPGTGPSGWYSHAWMSRADQSLTRHRPKSVLSASRDRHRLAERVARPDEAADLHLVVERAARAEDRRRRPLGSLRLARAAAAPACRWHDATTRGRDSRSAPTCSWAAAGCRGGTCCRRWSRGGPRRRSRCSRRPRPAASSSASACGTRMWSPTGGWRGRRRMLAQHGARLPRAAARQVAGPSAMSGLSAGAAHAPAGRRRQPGEPALVVARGQVEDVVADRHRRPRGDGSSLVVAPAEDAEGQVLDAGSRGGPWPTRPRSG